MLQNDTNTNIEQNCTDGVDDGRRRGEQHSWHYTPTASFYKGQIMPLEEFDNIMMTYDQYWS